MHRERASRQNIGPFRVHDAFVEVALLDLQSRLARTLVTVTVVGSGDGNTVAQAPARAPASRSSGPEPQTGIGPTRSTCPLHLPKSTPNLRR